MKRTSMMMTLLAALATCAPGPVPSAQGEPTLAPTPPVSPAPPTASPGHTEFELKIGDTVYDVMPDRPLTVPLPGGGSLPVILHRNREILYDDHGISFLYPSEMKVSASRESGVTTISVDSTNSTTATIQIFPDILTSAQVQQSLLSGMLGEIKRRGGRVRPTPPAARRPFGNIPRIGRAVEWTLAGSNFRTETYVFPKAEAIIAVSLQFTAADRQFADLTLSTITKTFQ